MNLIERLKERAKEEYATLVFPEGEDARVVEACALLSKNGIARPVILGEEEPVRKAAEEKGADLSGIKIIGKPAPPDLKRYVELYCRNRKKVSPEMARRLLQKKLILGAAMVSAGDADGMVAGACHSTASVIQAAGLAIGYAPGVSVPSSFFIMVLPSSGGGGERTLIYADAGVNIDPNAEQLADIGVTTGRTVSSLLGMEPRIAFLSFSTMGSASHPVVDKVIRAVKIAREKAPDLLIDGELQADAALVPEVAVRKVRTSAVAGKANVLIFPDLDSANIAYKITQYLAGAKAYGPILQGFRKPVNDLSRGASVEDIICVAAVTAAQGQSMDKRDFLTPQKKVKR